MYGMHTAMDLMLEKGITLLRLYNYTEEETLMKLNK